MPQENYPNLLKPTEDRTAEERRASAANAGRASGVSRRRRKTFRESLLLLLSMEPDDPQVKALLETLGLDPTNQAAIDLAQIRQARKGDTEAARFIRDTVGEKPTEQVELGGLADRPIQTIDLSALSDDQLRELAARKAEQPEE